MRVRVVRVSWFARTPNPLRARVVPARRALSPSGLSLDEHVRHLEGSAVQRMAPRRSHSVEKITPSGLHVPRAFGNALGSDLRRGARPFGAAALSLLLVACGGGSGVYTPPPDPDPDPDCDVNPIEQIANDAGAPYEWVRALGEDCEVDADERWFVEAFLPDLRERTTDTIAQTYPERFVQDDITIESDERLVLSRYFYGRENHEGVQITPGYFKLYDDNESNLETRLEIANASWVPLFATPFANRAIPGYTDNGYGEPYYSDGDMSSANLVLLPNHGGGVSFLEHLGSTIQPKPDGLITDRGPGTQFIFAQDQALVNELPHAVRVETIRYLENYGRDGTMVRNATLDFVPVSRSPSLGFSDLSSWIVHADADRLLVSEGDVIEPEQVWGYSELDLGGGIQVKWGFYTSDGQIGDGGPFTVLDPYDPSISKPESRGLIPQVALYRQVDDAGDPVKIFYGNLQGSATKDGRSMAVDGDWDPLVYTRP